MTSSSEPERAIEACSDGNGIGSYRISHYRCVDLLTNEIYDSLVEIYSKLIKLKMDYLKGYIDSYFSEAGPEYEGKMNLYLARLYISAFFHDLYVANRLACKQQQGCSDAYNKQYFNDMIYLSRTYDCFLAHLLGSILPTKIKHTHGTTLFVPLINPNIRRGDDNQNYLGITNWVYNFNCLNQFIYLCGRLRIMKMQPIPENVNGRPFWLFDWHDSSCYSWFPVESNYSIEDVAIAYIIGTACTARLAPRDYDEWQEFSSNVRPTKALANDYERVRGLVYRGYKLVRTMEVQSFVIPHNIVAHAVVRKPGSGGALPSKQEQWKENQLTSEGISVIQTCGGVKQPLSTMEVSGQMCASGAASFGTGKLPAESANEQGVHELSQSPSASMVLALKSAQEKKSATALIPNIEQFRLVDYLYCSMVICRHNDYRRWAGFVEMLWDNGALLKSISASISTENSADMNSSIHKGVVEACCEWIQLDRIRICHDRYVDLLRNEIYESLVERYSGLIQEKMVKLEYFANGFLGEAGPEYKGKMNLYLARVYISAFFHDLYVANRFACQQLCVEHHGKHLDYWSRKYDCFLARLLGSILPTEIKLTHERTLFIPRINTDMRFDDVNHNYFGIHNWVYNRNCLFEFILLCESNEILKMEKIPKNTYGRSFWLFDWHGNNCYSWFPVKPNCVTDDVAMAYIIGTACTSRLAFRDYDDWQQFPGNVRPVEAHPNLYKRVRDLVYHGSAMVRTMEERFFVIPNSVMACAVVRTPKGASSPTEQDQEHPGKLPRLQPGSELPVTELSNFGTRKKQRLATTELCTQTCIYDSGIETHDQQLVGSGCIREEGDDFSHSQTTSVVQALQPERQNENPIVLVPSIEQFRLVDYLYDSIVFCEFNECKRSKAFREMLRNEPNQESHDQLFW